MGSPVNEEKLEPGETPATEAQRDRWFILNVWEKGSRKGCMHLQGLCSVGFYTGKSLGWSSAADLSQNSGNCE